MALAAALTGSLVLAASCTPAPRAAVSYPPAASASPTPAGAADVCRTNISDFKITFDFGHGLSAGDKALIRRATATARRYYNLPVPACAHPSVVTHVSNTSAGAVLAQAIGVDHGSSTVVVFTQGLWPTESAAQKLQVLLHEWYHVVQFPFRTCSQYMAGCPQPTVHIPYWFIEGTAEYESVRAATTLGRAPFAAERAKRLTVARTARSPSLERMGFLNSYQLYTVAFGAVDYLIAKTREAQLKAFWWDIADTGNWLTSFRKAFGMPAKDFYDAFAKYRANGYQGS